MSHGLPASIWKLKPVIYKSGSERPKAGILGILDTEEHFPKPSKLRNIL